MAELIKGSEFLIRPVEPKEIFTPEDFDDEQRQIRDTTRELVEKEILPQVAEIDSPNFALSVKLLAQCGDLGLLMTDAAEEDGGLDLSKTTSMLVAEEIAHTGAFSVSFTAHTGIGTLPLVYYGTKAQKDKYLHKLITGEWPAAYCLTEPGSGSDALDVATTATLEGDHYVLNGTKQFITNGGFAKLFTVFAKINKEHFPGVSIGQEEKKLGIKGSSTTQVILDQVKVPKENLLGEVGKGHYIAFNILNVGRLKLGACVNGAAKEVIRQTAPYAKERKQFKQPIANFGAIQEKFANMTADLFAAESLVYRIAGDIDNQIGTLAKGPHYYAEVQKVIAGFAAECSVSKVYCSEVLAEVVDECLQVFGGYGFTAEYPAERFYRD